MIERSPASFARTAVLALSALAFAVGLFWIGKAFYVDGQFRFGNPIQAPTPEAVAPVAVRAEITRVVEGQLVRPGQRCEFVVQPRMHRDGSYECNAQIVCGAKLLYGGPERGYFRCKLTQGLRSDVVGTDPSTSRTDHDPAMQIDSRLGVLRIWDDASGTLGAFQVEAEILSAE